MLRSQVRFQGIATTVCVSCVSFKTEGSLLRNWVVQQLLKIVTPGRTRLVDTRRSGIGNLRVPSYCLIVVRGIDIPKRLETLIAVKRLNY
jgi:hypothetical protein